MDKETFEKLTEGLAESPVEMTAELVNHMLERQVYVQMLAKNMKDRGFNVESEFVRVDGHVPEGWVEISCLDCGRTAAAPASAVEDTTVAVCPPCMRQCQDAKHN